MRTVRWNLLRLALSVVTLVACAPVASAYYYWVFFPSNAGPFAPVMARFDLAALKDHTVQFFISDQGPRSLGAGDSAAGVYSQIQQAAAVWNGVASSALRLRFGGFSTVGLAQNTPGIDIVFDEDMPPGLLAQTTPTFPGDLSFLSDRSTSFVPIRRSRVQLRRDLTAPSRVQVSYSDAFFATVVHELGHALGLQHTLTSGAMSTAITRAVTRGAALNADDIAGISLLYPAPGFLTGTGSIAGNVARSADGVGVNLASVVALSTKGAAISALSNPDGTYRIDGIPPGRYYVYTHPLPPAGAGQSPPGDVVPPADPQNDSFPANTGFGAQFFPGTREWTQAAVLEVAAGAVVNTVNFAVAARTGPAVYGMTTYGYQNGVAVPAPPLPSAKRNNFVFYAAGATVNNQTAMAPGLRVSVIGPAADIEAGSLRYYTQEYLLMILDTSTVTENLPVALAVNLNNDLYVLPWAFAVVPNAPPAITNASSAIALGAVRTTVSGTGLNATTRILFDGVPAAVTSVSSDGTYAELVEPPAPSGYQATVEAVNADGQTSLQALGANAPVVYTYPTRDAVTIASTPTVLTAGTGAMITIRGGNTHFAQGRTVVGFGSSDIAVQRLWVVNPQLLLLNVSVDAAARIDSTTLTVSTGLESVSLPGYLRIAAAEPAQVSLRAPVINSVTGLAGVPAGGTALIGTGGLPVALDGWVLKIGGEATSFSVDKNRVLSARVPAGLAPGPQIVQLLPAGNTALPIPPVLLQLDAAPPVIVSAAVSAADGTLVPVTDSAPARGGDAVVLTVSGFAAPTGILPAAAGVWIDFGGTNYPAMALTAIPQPDGAEPRDLALVTFILPASLVLDPAVRPPAIAIKAGTGTRLSAGYALNVAPAPASQ